MNSTHDISKSNVELLELAHQTKDRILKQYAEHIKMMFHARGINPGKEYVIHIADYPDIISLDFERRTYTENCDSIEQYFRANLYYLMHQTDDLFFKYQKSHCGSKDPDQIYLYYQPISMLSRRLALLAKINPDDCFEQLLAIFTCSQIARHYLLQKFVDELSEPTTEQIYFIKTVSHVIASELLDNSCHSSIIQLNRTFYRHYPVKILKQYSIDEILNAFTLFKGDGEFTIRDLLICLKDDCFYMFD